jgi:hypothetical protein
MVENSPKENCCREEGKNFSCLFCECVRYVFKVTTVQRALVFGNFEHGKLLFGADFPPLVRRRVSDSFFLSALVSKLD